jgi:acrylyl-CoA reductase (NADPH)
MMITGEQPFRAFRIHAEGIDSRAGIETIRLGDLSPGEIVIKTAYSSVNYKDALAGTGKGKILRQYPLNGGIDVAGHVVASRDPRFREGDAVLVTGCGLSETRDGGYSEYARSRRLGGAVPAGLDLREAMIDRHRRIHRGAVAVAHAERADAGDGACRGDRRDRRRGHARDRHLHACRLRDACDQWQARAVRCADRARRAQCIARAGTCTGASARSKPPPGPAQWTMSAAKCSSGLTRVIQPYGNIASCGLAGGMNSHTTVMPFIIRGVSLLGINQLGTAYARCVTTSGSDCRTWRPRHLERDRHPRDRRWTVCPTCSQD